LNFNMARKLFISVLGAGFYENCVYVQDDFKAALELALKH